MPQATKENIDYDQIGNTLAKNGIVILEDYYSKDKCDNIYSKAINIVNKIDYDESEIGDEVGNTGKKFFKGGMQVHIRGGRDKGMFDISDVNNSIEELDDFHQDKQICRIIEHATGKKPSTQSTNLYYKNSNTSTRGPHHDTFHEKFKSFIYLTDVQSLSHGPYSYVEGSHNPSYFTQKATSLVNKIKGRPPTDSVFYDEESANRITGKKGTLIISNQTGVHFGQPQKEGFERMLVTNHHKF